jgi:RND superfamily putative drug exporter
MSPLEHSNNLAARMGRWSAGHWKTAVFGWLAFVVAALLIGQAMGTKRVAQDDANVGESRRADHILKDAGFQPHPQQEIVLVQSTRLGIDDPVFRAALEDVVRTVTSFRTITKLRSPLTAGHEGLVSRDGQTALVEWEMKGDEKTAKGNIDAVTAATAAVAERHPSLYIGQAGSVSSSKALNEAFSKQLKQAGTRSVPLTLLVLVLVFGAIVAAGIPLLLALSAVAATIGVLALPSHLIPLDSNVDAVVLLVGLAVGVDYTLFYLKREREERAAGRNERAALEAAAATSGRAVLVSGLTVMIAMAGMLFTGDPTFMGFGLATMAVVAVAMLGSLTVLPALLSKLGDRVEKGRIPFLRRLRRENGESRFWNGILTPALRRPALALAASTAVLLALAAPVLHLHTAETGLNSMAKSLPTVDTLQRIEASFPGDPSPAIVAVKADANSPQVKEAVSQLRSRALASGLMHGPIEVDASSDGSVTRVQIPFNGKTTGATANRALETLRSKLLPATVGRVEGATYAVTGGTASSHDHNATLKQAAPIVFGFVLTFAFLLLLVTFRSLVVAAKAIVLNLLSVAAAYGLMILVFQQGWGEGFLNFESNGAIAWWLPLFMFVILFGLSMDYHVFILSRIREAYDRGLSTEDAVAHGIKTTAGVVTSAALVMVGAFAIFATLPILDMKEMGIGLAAAVLIDATIVRAVLLPAAMMLLGDRNWYLPRWLEWLPRLEHAESRTATVAAGPSAQVLPEGQTP